VAAWAILSALPGAIVNLARKDNGELYLGHVLPKEEALLLSVLGAYSAHPPLAPSPRIEGTGRATSLRPDRGTLSFACSTPTRDPALWVIGSNALGFACLLERGLKTDVSK